MVVVQKTADYLNIWPFLAVVVHKMGHYHHRQSMRQTMVLKRNQYVN